MFDTDGSGDITLDEFIKIMNANKKHDENVDYLNNGIIRTFFGKDGKKTLKFEDFEKFLSSLKDEILRQEFLTYDVEGTGLISIEAFNELITSSVHFNSMKGISNFKKQLNVLKTRGFFAPTGRVDYDTFVAFHKLSQNIDDIGIAIQMYTAGGHSLRKGIIQKIG